MFASCFPAYLPACLLPCPSLPCLLAHVCLPVCLQVDLLMSERKEAKEAVQAQADTMKAAQVCPADGV